MQSWLGRALTAQERFFESLLRRTLGNEQSWLNGPTLREVAARNPELFVVAAISLLESIKSPPTRSRLYAKLSECPEFLLQLIYPDQFSRAQFLEICRVLKRIDDRLDIKLARLLPGRHADDYELPANVLLRLLDVLHAISLGPRLVQVLCHLTGHADPRIASKAVILTGHR
ncbi:MAG: hypothetical protein JO099_16110, partial [Acidobacteriia bacterium]|nr:hypothetical protein [Terriglobia bacterium]